MYRDVSDELIVQLRDLACLSWEEVGSQVEMTPDSVAIWYVGSGQTAARTVQLRRARTNLDIWMRNDAANHRDEIVTAYLASQSSEALAQAWGIPARTILRWGGEDGDMSVGVTVRPVGSAT